MICPSCHTLMTLTGVLNSTKETIHDWYCYGCHYSFKDVQKAGGYTLTASEVSNYGG